MTDQDTQYHRLLKLSDACTKVEGVKKMAQEGHGPAALLYGDWLMAGYWDEERMKHTLAREQPLLEATESGDPYLVLDRDPIEALRWYQMAVCSRDKNSVWEAQYKLAYCMKMGYAGLVSQKKVMKEELRRLEADESAFGHNNHAIQVLLDENAKSASKPSGDEETPLPFVPLPNVRPKMDNPRTELFKHMGGVIRNRCICQAVLIQLIAFIGSFFFSRGASSWGDYLLRMLFQNSIVGALYTLPLVLFACWANHVGVRNKQPICSCDKIRQAYRASLRRLPADCQSESDPFSETFFLSRNSHKLKRLFFWIQLVAALSFFAALICKVPMEPIEELLGIDFLALLFGSLITIPACVLIVAWDVKVPQLSDGLEKLQNLVSIACALAAPLMNDKDCGKEIDRADPQDAMERTFKRLSEGRVGDCGGNK